VELLVVVFIISIITVIVLFGGGRFDRSILLTDAAYEVSLAIREAQSYGVNVREESSFIVSKDDLSDAFKTGYGVHFDALNRSSFKIFADKFPSGAESGNGIFRPPNRSGPPDDDDDDREIRSYSLTRGMTITKFCGVTADRMEECSTDTSAPIAALDVVFTRPNPEPTITAINPGGQARNTKYSSAKLYLGDAFGSRQRTVTVGIAGQISVQ